MQGREPEHDDERAEELRIGLEAVDLRARTGRMDHVRFLRMLALAPGIVRRVELGADGEGEMSEDVGGRFSVGLQVTIADRIEALLADRASRFRLRESARELLDARYTAGPVMARLMDVYDRVARCA